MTKRLQFFLIFIFTSVVTYIYWMLYGKPLIGIDDANIYFVYVKNLMGGDGLVYASNGERVEGFTSGLWLFLISPLFLEQKYFELLVLLVNVLITSCNLFVCMNFLNQLIESNRSKLICSIVFLAFLVLVPGYFEWTILTLMETGLWSLLVCYTTIILCDMDIDKARRQLILLTPLLLLTRPESLLWTVVFMGLLGVRFFLLNGVSRKLLLFILSPGLSLVISLLLITSARMLYFGFPLPNTYYAKVSSNVLYNLIEGFRYFAFSIIQSPHLLIISVVALVSLIYLLRRVIKTLKVGSTLFFSDHVQIVLTIVSVVSLAIPIYVGGDHFKLLRFYQPFFPIYLLMILNVKFWSESIRARFAIFNSEKQKLIIVLCLVPLIYFMTNSPLHTFVTSASPLEGEFRLAELGREDGLKFNKFFNDLKTLPTIGVDAAGGFAFSYGGEVIDLMGLNNVKMAHALKEKIGMKNHAAFDTTTFFEQLPIIFHGYKKVSKFIASDEEPVLLENDPEFNNMHVFRLYKRMFYSPRFINGYLPVVIRKRNADISLMTYCRADFISQLMDSGYDVEILERKR